MISYKRPLRKIKAMRESSVEQDNSPSNTEPREKQASESQASSDYWQSFHLFQFSFEEFLFKYGWIGEIVLFLSLLLADFILDLHLGLTFLDAGSYLRTGVNWIPFLWNAGLIALLVIFNIWKNSIPRTIQFLISKSRGGWLVQGQVVSQDYELFLDSYQRKLLSKKRYILIGLLLFVGFGVILGAVLTNSYLGHPLISYKLDPFGVFLVWVWVFVSFIIPITLWSYAAGAGGWVIWVTGQYINKLTSVKSFDISIRPSHPDNCGGLKPLGNFFLAMVAPMLLGAIVLEVFDLGFFSRGGNTFAAFIAGANVTFLVVIIPLAFVASKPVLKIHRLMVAKEEREKNEFADHIEKLEKRLRISLDEGALKEAKDVKEEIEMVQILAPGNKNYPVWPFNIRGLITFWAAVILPFISFVSLLAQTLQSSLSIFFGTH
jgi:hypothetical protein